MSRGKLVASTCILYCFQCSHCLLVKYPTNRPTRQHFSSADEDTTFLRYNRSAPTARLFAGLDDSIVAASQSKVTVPISKNNNDDVFKSLFVSLCFLSTVVLSPLPGVAYDGFADYAQENKMQQSDVACFINQCGEQTKALGKDLRSIQGVVCLGQCKGEQSCATRCFAEFGGPTLDNWLSCTIEENECVKVPKPDVAITKTGDSYQPLKAVVKPFNADTLIGTWYKTDGLNPNYDLFDCQTNTFTKSSNNGELDMDIRLRISRPGGGFWENDLQEHMVLDDPSASTGRTMSTKGKMYGLSFQENWYIVGESGESDKIPPFKLVAYQGTYDGPKEVSNPHLIYSQFLSSFIRTHIAGKL
jgi:hypothetical protein